MNKNFEALLDVMLCHQCVSDQGMFPQKNCVMGCLPYPLRPSDVYFNKHIWLLRYKLIISCKRTSECECKICLWKVRLRIITYSQYYSCTNRIFPLFYRERIQPSSLRVKILYLLNLNICHSIIAFVVEAVVNPKFLPHQRTMMVNLFGVIGG